MTGPSTVPATATDRTALCRWLVACVADHLRRDPAEIATDVPLAEYGLDSVTALAVDAAIEDAFGVELAPNALWEHPTVDALVDLLATGAGA